MITLEHAKQLALTYLNDYFKSGWGRDDDEIVLLDEYTKDMSDCWIIYYDSKKFLETRHPSYSLLQAKIPLMVKKDDGSCEFVKRLI